MEVGSRRYCIRIVPLLLLVAWCQAARSAEYHLFKEPVELRERPAVVAVFSNTGQSPSNVLEFILGAGFDLSEFEGYGHGIPGWSVWKFQEKYTQAEIIARLVENDSGREYFFAPVFAGRSGGETIPANAILLRWQGEPNPDVLDEVRPGECSSEREPRSLGHMERAYLLRVGCHSGLALLDYANELARHDEIEFAEPDMIVGGEPIPRKRLPMSAMQKLVPGDPRFSDSWHLRNTGQEGGSPGMDIGAEKAWDMTTGAPDVVTVIIDTGVQQDHVDINQDTGNDFTSQSSTDGGPVNQCDNHGTPVAGVLSSPINDDLTVGVAPDSRIRSARAFISEVSNPCPGRWSTQFSWTVDALDWAMSIGARITNNSNSYDQSSSAIASKYEETRDAGMVHFASAGNDASAGMNFPASLASVNAVSAVNRTGGLASFSNFGTELSVSAPGVDIYASDRDPADGYAAGQAYAVLDGTSFASPIAAGVVALLFSRASNLDGRESELFLQASATDLGAEGFDEEYGWGMVQAETALQLLDIFEDDLETGDTSRWSVKVPQ